MRHIYLNEGIRSFYSGVAVGMVGVSIYHGSGFFLFTLMKEEVILHRPSLKSSKAVDFAIGGFGALTS